DHSVRHRDVVIRHWSSSRAHLHWVLHRHNEQSRRILGRIVNLLRGRSRCVRSDESGKRLKGRDCLLHRNLLPPVIQKSTVGFRCIVSGGHAFHVVELPPVARHHVCLILLLGGSHRVPECLAHPT